jgi:HK97 family phage portal protein
VAYQARSGDVISLDDSKAGSLTMSVPLLDWPGFELDPATLWEQQAAIRIVVGFVARRVSSIPMHIYRRVSITDRERVFGTPVERMMRYPSPGRGWSRFCEQIITDMAVHDRWACLIQQGPDGPFLERLPAHRVAIRTVLGVPQELILFGENAELGIPLDRVIYDVGPSAIAQTFDRGSTRLPTLGSLVVELEETSRWRRQVAEKGPRVSAVIERPSNAPKWNDEAWNRFRRSWRNYSRGGGDEGGTPLLEDGMTLREMKTLTPDDGASGVQLRSLTIEEAAMLYGIPPELVGVRPGNYSNVQAYRELEYVDVLGSWVMNLENAFNVGLHSAGLLDEMDYCEANVDSRLRGAFEQQAAVLSSAVGAPWMTRNEARARANMPAVPEGDDLITPLNVIVGGQTSPQDGTTEKPGLPPNAPPQDEEPAQSSSRKALAASLALDEEQDYPIGESGWQEVIVAQAVLKRQMRRFWREQHERIQGHARALKRPSGPSQAVLDDIVRQEALNVVLAASYPALVASGADQILETWNPARQGYDADRTLPWARKVAQSNATEWSIALAAELSALAGLDDKDALDDFIGNPDRGSALLDRSLRTWTTEGVEFGRHDAAAGSGLRVKTWHTTSRAPRATHAALSGTALPVNQSFSIGARWPGDRQAGPDQTAGCRCRLTYQPGS